jgi:hypothetical protein
MTLIRAATKSRTGGKRFMKEPMITALCLALIVKILNQLK